MTTRCPNCGHPFELTPSGMATCPRGDAKLYPAAKELQPIKSGRKLLRDLKAAAPLARRIGRRNLWDVSFRRGTFRLTIHGVAWARRNLPWHVLAIAVRPARATGPLRVFLPNDWIPREGA